MTACVVADAPFPGNVHAFTTLRHGAGASSAPFDTFNLGNFRGEAGDDPAVVARNRAELVQRFALPSMPHWLKQVHGTEVVRFDAPALPPPQPSPASGGGGKHGDGMEGMPGDGAEHQHGNAMATGNGAERQHGNAMALGDGVERKQGNAVVSGDVVAAARAAAAVPPLPLAGEGWGGGEPEADAAITATPGVVLAILTADCLPVVFAAKDGSEVAIAHAGWPGLSSGMLEATLAAMRTPATASMAWIGPAAGPARYEVGRDVFDVFVAHDPDAATAFVPTRPGHWLADLPALARMRLVVAGMAAGDIHGGDLCTISEPQRFFSHRRDGRSGRMATIAWID